MTIELIQNEEKEIKIPMNKVQISFDLIQFEGETTPGYCVLVFDTSECIDFSQSAYSKSIVYRPEHQNNVFPVIPNSSIKISIKTNNIEGQHKFRLEYNLS